MQRFRVRAAVLAVVLAASLAGCGEENPLLGTWRLNPEASGIAGAYAETAGVGREIVFEEDRMIMKGEPRPVDYEVVENSVRIVPEDGSEMMVLRVVGGEYFLMDTPLGQPLRFEKVEGEGAPEA